MHRCPTDVFRHDDDIGLAANYGVDHSRELFRPVREVAVHFNEHVERSVTERPHDARIQRAAALAPAERLAPLQQRDATAARCDHQLEVSSVPSVLPSSTMSST